MFAGLGPPPETAEGWVITAREQELRYCMLMGVGLFELLAFRFLYQALQEKDAVFASIGWVCILIAIPLFFINMTYWSSYLPKLFQQMQEHSATELPDWAQPLRKQFGMISTAEVVLTYFATAAFTHSLSVTGFFKKGAAKIYIILSLLAAMVMILSVFFSRTTSNTRLCFINSSISIFNALYHGHPFIKKRRKWRFVKNK